LVPAFCSVVIQVFLIFFREGKSFEDVIVFRFPVKVISIDGVSVIPDEGYGLCVKDVSIDISLGEVVVVYGNAGSGKSVLLGGIAGVVPLSQGEVFCKEQELIDVSYQPEIPLLPHSMTVGTYCKRINLAVPEVFRLNLFERRLICELSASERRQLWVMSIHSRIAHFYIYDEPALGFDFRSKEECASLLISQAKSKFVLVATSDPLFAAMIAHRIVHLVGGVVSGELLMEDSPSRSSCTSRLEQIISFSGK
jgi:ABC-type cobalamin/Fe3+-siderophores transport system ATPase subunit